MEQYYTLGMILVMIATNNPRVKTLISCIIPKKKGGPANE